MSDIEALVDALPKHVLDAADPSTLSAPEKEALLKLDPAVYKRLFSTDQGQRLEAKKQLFRELFRRAADARARIERDAPSLAS